MLYQDTPAGGVNNIYLGSKLIAKDGFIPNPGGTQNHRPYGSSIEGEADDIGYTGHKFDTDLGLSYMQARYYDPVIGRFYSNDPVDASGHMQRGNNPAYGFNRYAYANNNPYKYNDPDGEYAQAVAVFNGGRKIGQAINFATEVITGASLSTHIADLAFDLIHNNESSKNSEGESLVKIVSTLRISILLIMGVETILIHMNIRSYQMRLVELLSEGLLDL
ncbi:RHS repeat-associated core domain-containing protein [Aestuariibacter sp. AA17]|uniref:RHS repeat-associated core domain-containing protein n=1 Tax=Fluctibacter corallii TaxID=2984329 RepID=A0ABT3ACT4_9ALTE|nr:RHS repeat-associated core domain-containing protein [Aestuariibacter sp. AA17]MCV2886491.1 RHS repeat-associated core domain-containing protein [Aestuariibacter sp. AA17]